MPPDSSTPAEEMMDNTLGLDFEALHHEESRLAELDRGLEAARARSSQSRSLGSSNRSTGSSGLEDISMAEVGEVMEIDESFSGAGGVFFVEEVHDDFSLVEVSSAEGFIVLDDQKALDLSAIVQEPLPRTEYYQEEVEKRQIYLHHTVSPGDPMISINWWNADRNRLGRRIRVATCIVVAGSEGKSNKYHDGQIYQCFPSGYWAHHLGVSSRANLGKIPFQFQNQLHNVSLNKRAIGIELACWGPLAPLRNGNFTPYDHYKKVMKNFGTESKVKWQIPASRVIEYPQKYRGFRYFERYTTAQIESLRQLLVYFCEKYNIPRGADKDVFQLDKRALRGDKGIFTHTSVRADKSDCHPQPELLSMLRNM